MPIALAFSYQSEDFNEPYIVSVIIEPGAPARLEDPGYPPEAIIEAVKLGSGGGYDISALISDELLDDLKEYALDEAHK
tara:strand:+ start:178 stop:414 length:237 start_codon:yes stop_codon:yes gene_type:complete